MAAVQSTTTTSSTTSSSAAAKAKASSSSSADIQDRFLNLLVAQISNQDPLNPMDNAQMTTQLAQINTVTGIEKLNTTLNSLVDGVGSSQSIQAAQMLGKSVLVEGTQLSLAKGEAYGGVNLAAAADSVTLTISDASGTVLQTQNLGARDAGSFNFNWDGKTDAGVTSADGAYKFSVSATQGGNTVAATPLQVGTVSALVRSGSGFLLDLGSLGTVDFKSVQQIL